MIRYFCEIAYDGTDFFGWQIQPDQPSVEEAIEAAMTRLNSNRPVDIVGCGRTDTGVHASKYIFHVDLPQEIDCDQWRYKLNKMLGEAIAIHSIYPVSETIHARFSAFERTYHYFVHQDKDPFRVRFSTYFPLDLDLDRMNEAAHFLLGEHDFTTFSKANTDVNHHRCQVTRAQWTRKNDQLIFTYTANRFLRNMVRATVGTLFDVGTHKLTVREFSDRFHAQNRDLASGSAPANGLHLADIKYPQ